MSEPQLCPQLGPGHRVAQKRQFHNILGNFLGHQESLVVHFPDFQSGLFEEFEFLVWIEDKRLTPGQGVKP